MKSIAIILGVLVRASQTVNPAINATTTAPAGLPEQVPPTSTIYGFTSEWQSAFPCAGKALTQASTSTYPASLYTTTVTADEVVSTSFSCGTETYMRSDAIPIPPTFTSYLNTVTTTSSLVCGGYEIASINPNYFFIDATYNATVTSPTTTQVEVTCTSHQLSVDTATYSTCTSIAPTPTFPRDYEIRCPRSIDGLSGCAFACGQVIHTYPVFNCFDRDISHDFNWSNTIRPGCIQCLPPCTDGSLDMAT